MKLSTILFGNASKLRTKTLTTRLRNLQENAYDQNERPGEPIWIVASSHISDQDRTNEIWHLKNKKKIEPLTPMFAASRTVSP